MKILCRIFLVLLVFAARSALAETLTHKSNLRKAASSSSEILAELPSGTQVTLTSSKRRGHYYHVKLADGRIGWVLAKNIAAGAAGVTPSSTPCSGVTTIKDCPQDGCPNPGAPAYRFDKDLNRAKNALPDNRAAVNQTVSWMQALQDPDPTVFNKNNTNRDVLKTLHEGDKITVVALAVGARRGGRETCNCGLDDPYTDVHIVLVDPSLQNPTLAANEKQSETAEFTPRIRLDQHPNFTYEKLGPLLNPAWKSSSNVTSGNLLVRVTGFVMFDSFHFLYPQGAPKRHNNWEIHPVLKFEYCPEGKTCEANSDQNWIDFDSL